MTEEKQQAGGELEATAAEPMVIEPKKKKKKKKYSKGLQGPQELLRASSKAQAKVASAVSIALDDWVARTEKSGGKRKDGMLKDGLINAGRAATKGVRKALKAPETFMDEIEKTKLYKKRFKPFRLI